MRRTFVIILSLSFALFSTACAHLLAAPASQGSILFQDSFSNPESGWDRVSGADGVTDYDNGMYRIFSLLSDYYMWATPRQSFPANVSIEVTAIKKAGPNDNLIGILCRYQDSANYYILMISSDGMAGIAKMANSEGPSQLEGAELRPHDAVHTGNAANLLRAECIGTTLRLFANNTLVASAEDNSIMGGGNVGLWINAREFPGADVFFDDLFVRAP